MALFRSIILAAAAFIGVYAYFLAKRILGFFGLDMKKTGGKLLAGILAVLSAAVCSNLRNTSAMAGLHILVISLGMDAVSRIVRLFWKKRRKGRAYMLCRKLYACGLVPFVVTAAMFLYGHANMGRVVRTEYSVVTDKKVSDYKVVLITDTHYATIQDTDLLKEKIEDINQEEPDIVILGGDIVDEGTSKEKMEEVFARLGGLKHKYGIYFVYGNHDRQPYTDQPAFTEKELEAAVEGNGITILEDAYVEIGDDLIIAGRADAAWGNVSGRAASKMILEGTDPDKFIIMADHQPVEAEDNDRQGVDLQVSGHTHAGQIWPVGHINALTGMMNYGEYRAGDCRVIVSSGFTGWGYPVRTEEHCEYVVINISGRE